MFSQANLYYVLELSTDLHLMEINGLFISLVNISLWLCPTGIPLIRDQALIPKFKSPTLDIDINNIHTKFPFHVKYV